MYYILIKTNLIYFYYIHNIFYINEINIIYFLLIYFINIYKIFIYLYLLYKLIV